MDEFSEIFKDEIGCIKDITVNIDVKTMSRPLHLNARTIPYAMINRVNTEIDRLEEIDVLEKIKFSEWTTPIVPIVKANGKDIRICGDYKVTINKCIVPEHYPMPYIERILASMHDARFFAKFDIREAYLHMLTNEKTAELLTITTPTELYKVERMLYSITNAPAIWQRTMDNLFINIPGVCIFYDDVKITGRNEVEFVSRIRKFFEICKENGIRLKREKCEIGCESINYLGYRIDKHGLHKTTKKIDAIVRAKRPENVTEVKSFLGLVNYYSRGRFIPNASNILHPLYEPLKKGNDFTWNKSCNIK